MIRSKITGTGSYLPTRIMTNEDLSKMVDTSDEWIVERTGIKERHIVEDGELTSDMALEASLEAIANAKIDKNDIDMIVFATTTPDKIFPATATILQKKLGLENNCFAFDVQAVCSGFIYSMNIADNFIKSGQVKTVLVVGADSMSKLIDWTDRNTCVLFGDGAGAVILQATEGENGILNCILKSDAKYNDILDTTGGVSSTKTIGTIHMEGKEVFKVAVTKMADCVAENIEKCGLRKEDIKLLIPHQANQRIISGVGNRLGLLDEQVISTVAHHANTSAGSVPLALDYAVKNNRIKSGDIIVLEALGGGITWGSIIIRW